MIGGPDDPDRTQPARRPILARRSLKDLADLKKDLEAREEEKRIEALLCPPHEDGVERRAGVTKRGSWIYYRSRATARGEKWDEDARCNRAQEIGLRCLVAQNKITLYYKAGCQLFYRA